MPGRSDYEREIQEARLGEGWRATGSKRIVKVTGIPGKAMTSQMRLKGITTLDEACREASRHLPPLPPSKPGSPSFARMAKGYVTLEEYIVGLTPYQIQRALGLQLGDLKGGCRVYRFKRPPQVGEYTGEGTADLPGGLAPIPGARENEMWRRRNGQNPAPMYRPGDPLIPQWSLQVCLEVETPPYELASGTPYPVRP